MLNQGPNDGANDTARALEYGHGIRIVLRRHHSTEVIARTGYPRIAS
jgi:hypothetical protein